MSYANEPSQAAFERSSQDAYDVIRLTRSKADSRGLDDLVRYRKKCFKEVLSIYLFTFTLSE